MSYNSIFDIIGPIMVGPSSSHTAGAVRIGQVARSLYGATAELAEISFYGSFAHTYRGHGTDLAVVAGILGCSTFDERIPEAFQMAEEQGLSLSITAVEEEVPEPNTARIKLSGDRDTVEVLGVSVGGGAVEIREINGFKLNISGDKRTLLLFHQDRAGTVAEVASRLALRSLNISHMELSRKQRGETALLSLECDQIIDPELIQQFSALAGVIKVIYVRP
ncbi:MAG: L-serine ammonia-lyase, iron-sulfur-dependent subunit beta [Eubacteriales bacterium]|nr:L-serine ammonia-lyase, iron-sulfur-dependent subunit beta [Eubacteriales bacterium]